MHQRLLIQPKDLILAIQKNHYIYILHVAIISIRFLLCDQIQFRKSAWGRRRIILYHTHTFLLITTIHLSWWDDGRKKNRMLIVEFDNLRDMKLKKAQNRKHAFVWILKIYISTIYADLYTLLRNPQNAWVPNLNPIRILNKLATARLFRTIELVNLFIISLDFFLEIFYHGFLIFFFI